MAGVIDRYRERLPLEPGDPVVTLNEGSTPLIGAPVISERVGATVYLKLEGVNPTGSFKDRGMTLAVSRAKGEGAEAIICASTGNTAASAAAYAARAGLRGAVIVPEGKIAIGKLAQALMHGARVIALRGNFDQALEIVRELARRHPVELVNSVNPYRIEGQKTAAFETCEELAGPPDALAIPDGDRSRARAAPPGRARELRQPVPDRGPEDRSVRDMRGARRTPRRARDPRGQRRQHHRLVARVHRVRGLARALRVPGRGSRAPRPRKAGGRAGNDRLRHQDRQPGALGGGDGCGHGFARQDRGGVRRADPRCLPPARLPGGRLLRAGVRGVGGRHPRAWPAGSGVGSSTGQRRLRADGAWAQGSRHGPRQGAAGHRLRGGRWRGRASGVRLTLRHVPVPSPQRARGREDTRRGVEGQSPTTTGQGGSLFGGTLALSLIALCDSGPSMRRDSWISSRASIRRAPVQMSVRPTKRKRWPRQFLGYRTLFEVAETWQDLDRLRKAAA